MKKILLFIVMGIPILGLLSCQTDNSGSELIGRWQDINFPQYEIEFSENGKIYNFTNGEEVSWGYFSEKELSLILEYTYGCEGDNCIYHFIYTITGEELIFTNENNDKFVFRQVE